VKDLLKTTTAEAVAEGAYGLPYMVYHMRNNKVESFFGSDRFELAAAMLGMFLDEFSLNRDFALRSFSFSGQEWKGPIPDPDNFKALENSPAPEEMYMPLEEFDKLNAAFVEEAERTRRPVKPEDLK
jgi:hypothetical protein